MRVPAAFYGASLGLSLLLVSGCIGCHSVSSSAVLPAPVVPAAQRSTTLSLLSVTRIQSLPLYQQAQPACQKQQFRQVASLLERLSASPDLSAEEVVFCQQQRQLCLTHLQPATSKIPVAVTDRPPTPQGGAVSSSADCGPRALLLVCRQLGIKTSLPALTQAAETTDKGTSLDGLAKAARSVGLQAEGVQMSREALSEARMPALAWVRDARTPDGHYIAVLKVQGSGETGTALIHDPNQAQEETIPQETLLRRSNGYLLLLTR